MSVHFSVRERNKGGRTDKLACSKFASLRVLNRTRHHPVVGTLVMEHCPGLNIFFQSIRVVTIDESSPNKATHTVHRPRPTRERVIRSGGSRQADVVEPRKGGCLFGVTIADAQCAGEEEGLHDGIVGGAIAYPA